MRISNCLASRQSFADRPCLRAEKDQAMLSAVASKVRTTGLCRAVSFTPKAMQPKIGPRSFNRNKEAFNNTYGALALTDRADSNPHSGSEAFPILCDVIKILSFRKAL